MRHDGLQFITMEMTKELVTLIPNAQLALIEGTWSDNVEAMVDRAAAFLNPDAEAKRAAHPEAVEAPSGMTAILFADIADSTALTERLGDAAFRAKARDLDAALRTVIRDHDGTPIEGKLLGDGVLAVSPAPARRSRPRSPAPARATTRASPSTSASTPVTSSAKTTTSTAAP